METRYLVPDNHSLVMHEYRQARRFAGPADAMVRTRNMYSNAAMIVLSALDSDPDVWKPALENLRQCWDIADKYVDSCHSRPTAYWWSSKAATFSKEHSHK